MLVLHFNDPSLTAIVAEQIRYFGLDVDQVSITEDTKISVTGITQRTADKMYERFQSFVMPSRIQRII